MKNIFRDLTYLDSELEDQENARLLIESEGTIPASLEGSEFDAYITDTVELSDASPVDFFAGAFDAAHQQAAEYNARRAAAEVDTPARESRLRRAGIALASAALFAAAMTGSYLYVKYTSEVQHDQVEYLDKKLKECKNSIPLDVSADVRFKQELACSNSQG